MDLLLSVMRSYWRKVSKDHSACCLKMDYRKAGPEARRPVRKLLPRNNWVMAIKTN